MRASVSGQSHLIEHAASSGYGPAAADELRQAAGSGAKEGERAFQETKLEAGSRAARFRPALGGGCQSSCHDTPRMS